MAPSITNLSINQPHSNFQSEKWSQQKYVCLWVCLSGKRENEINQHKIRRSSSKKNFC